MRFEQRREGVSELAVNVRATGACVLEWTQQGEQSRQQVRGRGLIIVRTRVFLCGEWGATDPTYMWKGSLWLRINCRGQREKAGPTGGVSTIQTNFTETWTRLAAGRYRQRWGQVLGVFKHTVHPELFLRCSTMWWVKDKLVPERPGLKAQLWHSVHLYDLGYISHHL